MARPDPNPADRLSLLADLQVELSSPHGDAVAHLHGEDGGLVLDVDNPVVLLRETMGHYRDDAVRALGERLPGTAVRLRSSGRNLARLSLSDGGRLRVWPTPRGVVAVARAAATQSRRRLLAASGGPVLALVLAAGVIRRRLASTTTK